MEPKLKEHESEQELAKKELVDILGDEHLSQVR
jgi:hypothetical protein